MSWLSDAFKGVGKALGGIANVAAMVPGPIGTVGKVISVIGAATSKDKNPADQTQQYIQQGADAQMAYQQAALDQYMNLSNRQLAVGTADKQMAYDIARGQFGSNQQNMLPYQQASLSALQALPQMQQLLGMPAYNISQNISQYTPPEVNYAKMYENSQNAMFPQAIDNGTVATADGTQVPVPAGPTGNPVMAPVVNGSIRGEGEVPSTTVSPGATTTEALTPYTGAAYDMDNSPIFQWQKQQAQEALNAQLAAAGLTGGTYAQKQLSNQNMAMAGAERDRVIGNMQGLVNLGMSGAQLGQASFQTPQSANVAGMYGQQAQDVAGFYGNMGAIQGQLGSQTAQNMMAGMNAQAQQPSGLQTAMQLASSYGWLNPSSGGSSSSVSSGSGYQPFTQNFQLANTGPSGFGNLPANYGFGYNMPAKAW